MQGVDYVLCYWYLCSVSDLQRMDFRRSCKRKHDTAMMMARNTICCGARDCGLVCLLLFVNFLFGSDITVVRHTTIQHANANGCDAFSCQQNATSHSAHRRANLGLGLGHVTTKKSGGCV